MGIIFVFVIYLFLFLVIRFRCEVFMYLVMVKGLRYEKYVRNGDNGVIRIYFGGESFILVRRKILIGCEGLRVRF